MREVFELQIYKILSERIWERFDERYGSPELIESVLKA